MHYKKYTVKTSLFALRDPRLAAKARTPFSEDLRKELAIPPAAPRLQRAEER